jgi:hypothetical protein
MGAVDYPRTERLALEAGVQMHLDCYCHTCRLWHRPQPCTPDQFSREMWDWHAKHVGHDFEFLSPRRRLPRRFTDWVWQQLGWAPWWLEYRENTNFKLAFGTATAITITLTTLASSANWVAGRGSVAIDNTSARNIDSEITARITTGTTPTVDTEIRIYGVQATQPDTPTWPDTITGTDAAVTLTSTYTRDGGIKPLLGATAVSATSNITYPIACMSTAQAWGKEPKRWALYVSHSTVAALNGTQTAPVLTYTSSYLTDT